jgi:hypothetical protein
MGLAASATEAGAVTNKSVHCDTTTTTLHSFESHITTLAFAAGPLIRIALGFLLAAPQPEFRDPVFVPAAAKAPVRVTVKYLAN